SPLAMGGFATTLLTFSLSLMDIRGTSIEAIHSGNLILVAGLGLLISAQWEMARGNTFSYTVLSAFGLFYASYGVMMLPFMGVIEAYGGLTPAYYNAMGFYLLIWGIFNLFFLIASLPKNIVYISIFTTVELCFLSDAASHFAFADHRVAIADGLGKTSGAFGFVAGLLGYYATAHYLCEEALPFRVPMGDTSRFFRNMKKSESN
ncbi:hypothetical protein BU24DRAFT_352987, partial [Aaosphaeria arxii CBS 175.79]